jgi:HEPN domain-containing protein
MSHDQDEATGAKAWLSRAQSNLAKAKLGRDASGIFYEDWCFDAQQAAEKSIKAILVLRNIQVPKTHDLMNLLTLVQRSGLETPETILEADELTQYAVETRYPSLDSRVDLEEYQRAIELAERVVLWSESIIVSDSSLDDS